MSDQRYIGDRGPRGREGLVGATGPAGPAGPVGPTGPVASLGVTAPITNTGTAADPVVAINAASAGGAGSQSVAHWTLCDQATDAATASTLCKRDGAGATSFNGVTCTG